MTEHHRGVAGGHTVFILHGHEQETVVGCPGEMEEELNATVLNDNGL